MRRLLLVWLAAALIVSGCTDKDSDAEKSAARKAQEDVETRVLSVTDLPSVYSTVRVAKRENKSRCGLASSIETKGRIASAEVAFQSTDTQAQLYEIVSRYERGKAAELMAAVRKFPTDCASYTEKQGDQEVTLNTAKLEFPTVADDTVALAVTGSVASTQLSFEQVFMRSGDTLIVLVHGGLVKVDTKLTEELARKAAEKVAKGPTASTIPSPSTTTSAAA